MRIDFNNINLMLIARNQTLMQSKQIFRELHFVKPGVLNLFMVRANLKNGLYAGGHQYTNLRSSVKVVVPLVYIFRLIQYAQGHNMDIKKCDKRAMVACKM